MHAIDIRFMLILVAATDSNEKCLPGNGLFESKVMSRNHATISVKGDKVCYVSSPL